MPNGYNPTLGERLSAASGQQPCSRTLANQVSSKRSRPASRRLLHQLCNFLFIVLLGVAVRASIAGKHEDAAVVAGVARLNATLRFVQEHRTGAALAERLSMVFISTVVPRGRTMPPFSTIGWRSPMTCETGRLPGFAWRSNILGAVATDPPASL